LFLCKTKNGVKTFVHYLSAAEAIVVKSGNNAFEYYFPDRPMAPQDGQLIEGRFIDDFDDGVTRY
jgi:hypothetical protein